MAQGGYKFLFDLEADRGARVFLDPTFFRRRRFRRLLLTVVCVFFAWTMLFLDGALSVHRVAEEIRFWWLAERLPVAEPAQRQDDAVYLQTENIHPVANSHSGQSATCPDSPRPAFAANAEGTSVQFFGHIPTELEWAPLSLESSCGALDVLIPDWLSIKPSGDGLKVDFASDSVREPVEAYLNRAAQRPRIMPTVALEPGFDLDGFLDRLSAPETISTISRDLVAVSEVLGASGLCLDFRQLNNMQLASLDPLFNQTAAELKKSGLTTCMITSVEQGVWENRDLLRYFDTVILMAFRQPWVGSAPGPLAPDAWLEDLGRRALAVIGPERLTLAIGNFAVEWTQRRPLPEILPFGEALLQVSKAEATLAFNPETGISFSSYRDQSGKIHRIFLLDAASANNQIMALRDIGIRQIGIWSLGREDPGLWQVIAEQTQTPTELAAGLSVVTLPNYVSYQGNGPFLRILSEPSPGLRLAHIDAMTGKIDKLEYKAFPTPFVLERYGRASPEKLVLTFDDGPHAEYTAAILDALKDTQTLASFFVVGTQIMEEPDLLRRIIDEGHEVGSHTFSHPRMDQISRSRTDLEHGMMRKLIAGYTGHSTQLYREPFLRGGGPIEAARVYSLKTVQNEGGIIAGMEIVPKDWEGMSTDAIVSYVLEEVEKGSGNVILLHDGGKDRSATVKAVPILIDALRKQGYEFTTLAGLLGIEREVLMPAVAGSQLLFDRVSFEFLSLAWFSLELVFWVVLGIGIVRMLMIFFLAQIRRGFQPVDDGRKPSVAVLIPAFNEEKVIASCINSVLQSDYENFEVIVVDDGSQDETFNEVLRFRNNPKVQIFAQLNHGKWSALNAAIANSSAEIIVCIDADTRIEPDAIRHLVRHFGNPKVGAVAGKITVGNRKRLLTRLQALEYITAQNFDRRAFDLINGLMVVPGAIGAWRAQAVREAGRFCNDTMTEDADLTIAVNRAGYRVTYEDNAVAYTEAPESIRQLLAQRLRWTLGMFQCAWKHKGAFRERRAVGMVSIPDMLIFGYLFPLLAPIADLFVLILLYNVLSGAWSGEVGTAVTNTPTHLIWAYMILPLLDLFIAAYALKTDKHEKLALLLLFPFQRFFYRQLLYLSVYRSLLRALSGNLVGWGRMQRSGRLYLEPSAQ